VTAELLRIGKILYPEEEFKRICYWILSCIQLEFSASTIIAAHCDQRRFHHITSTALTHMIEASCVKIQAMFRRFVAVKRVQKILDGKRKIRQGQILARIRARSRYRKTRRGRAFVASTPEETKRFAKLTLNFAPTTAKKKEGVFHDPEANKPKLKKVVIDPNAEEVVEDEKQKKDRKQKNKTDSNRKKSNFGGPDRLQESIQGIGETNTMVYHSRFDTNNQIKNLRKEISGTLGMFEDEIVSLKTELQSQKLNYFYGSSRGVASFGYNPNDEEGSYAGRPEGSDLVSGLSSRSGYREHTSLQMKEDVESLKNKINELELHLSLQLADSQMVELKAKDEIAKSEQNAAKAIEEAVAKAKQETIREIESQLAQKQQEYLLMEQKVHDMEKKNEESLQSEIAAKYQVLEAKLQAEFVQVTQRQEQLRLEMAEMIQKQKEELEKLAAEQKAAPPLQYPGEQSRQQVASAERTDTRQSDEVFSEYGDDMSHYVGSSMSTKYHLRGNNAQLKDAAMGLKHQNLREAAAAGGGGKSGRSRRVSRDEVAVADNKGDSNQPLKESFVIPERDTSLNLSKFDAVQPAQPVSVPAPVVQEEKKAGFLGWLFGAQKKHPALSSSAVVNNFAPPPQPIEFHFGDSVKQEEDNKSKPELIPPAAESAIFVDLKPLAADGPSAPPLDRKSSMRGSRGSFLIMPLASSSMSNLEGGETANVPDTPKISTRPNSAMPLALDLLSRGSARPFSSDPFGAEGPPSSPPQTAASAVALLGSLISSSMIASTKSLTAGSTKTANAPGTANSNATANQQLHTLEEVGGGDDDVKDDKKKAPVDAKETFARKIQKGTRKWMVQRKSTDPSQMQPLVDAMLPLVYGTRHEKVIDRALLLSIQSKHNELANKTINRIVELMLKFDRKGSSFPINLSHIMTIMKLHLADSFIINKGFSSMYLMMKGAMDNFDVGQYLLEMEPLFLLVFNAYPEDGTVCYKLFKCLYRVVEMVDATGAAVFATPAIADILCRGFELHHTKSNVLENILKAVSNLAQGCVEGRDVLGQMRVGDCLLMSVMNHYEAEKLLLLHCKGIMNLCINNHYVNQDLFSRGIYSNIFVKLLVMFRHKEAVLPCLIRTIVAININNELVMTKFESAGLSEVLLDLLTQPGQELSVITLCAWALSHVLTHRQPALRPMYQRVLQILHHCQQHFAGTDVGDEVLKAMLRMARPTLRAATPFSGEFYGKELGLEGPEHKVAVGDSAFSNNPNPSPGIPNNNNNNNNVNNNNNNVTNPNGISQPPKHFTFSTRSVKSSPSNSITE
jgi:hypothetical protein